MQKQVCNKNLSEGNPVVRCVKLFKNVDENGAIIDYDVVMRESVRDTRVVVEHADNEVAMAVFNAICNAYNYGYLGGLREGLEQAE